MNPLIRHRYRWLRSVTSDYVQDNFMNLIFGSQIIFQGALLATLGLRLETFMICMIVLAASGIILAVASLTPAKTYDSEAYAAAKREHRLTHQRQRLRRSNPELHEVNDAYLDEIYTLQASVSSR